MSQRRVLAPDGVLYQTGATKKKRTINKAKVEADLFMEFDNSSSSVPDYGAVDRGDDVAPDSAFENVQVKLNILDCRDEVLAKRIKMLENVVLQLKSQVDNLRNGITEVM